MASAKFSDLRTIAKEVKDTDWGCRCLGLRVVDRDFRGYNYKPGRIAPRSWSWHDGDHTRVRLGGTCCISLDYLRDEPHSTIEDIMGSYSGRRVWLIGGDWSQGGEDAGEIIIEDAKILKIIDLD